MIIDYLPDPSQSKCVDGGQAGSAVALAVSTVGRADVGSAQSASSEESVHSAAPLSMAMKFNASRRPFPFIPAHRLSPSVLSRLEESLPMKAIDEFRIHCPGVDAFLKNKSTQFRLVFTDF